MNLIQITRNVWTDKNKSNLLTKDFSFFSYDY